MRQAIVAGKHIHIEKPTAPTVDEAMELARLANTAGLKHGVIQDKLFLPGFAKLLFVKNAGFFGRILSIKIDAGSWIFDGRTQPCQRPSWNYRNGRGRRHRARYDGALALHDRPARRARARRLRTDGHRHPASGWTSMGDRYTVDVEDTSHALLRLAGGAVGVITNSWATRVRRDDTMVVQIDGTRARRWPAASAASRQARSTRRRSSSAAARPAEMDFSAHWQEVPDTLPVRTPSGSAGRLSCATSPRMRPYLPTLVEGAKAVQLADLAYRSVAEGRWMELPDLTL